MTVYKGRSRRKASGGRYKRLHKKKQNELGRDAAPAVLGIGKPKKIRIKGGHSLTSLMSAAYANVSDGKTVKKMKIKDVTENLASRHFVRKDVVTKGAVIKTDIGLARVTSRPTRDGVVNAILLPTKSIKK